MHRYANAPQAWPRAVPFLWGLGMLTQEAVERTHPGLVLADAYIGPVAPEQLWLRHRKVHSRLAGISQDELAGSDWSALSGQWRYSAAFDGGLANEVLAEGVAVARLRPEFLRG